MTRQSIYYAAGIAIELIVAVCVGVMIVVN